MSERVSATINGAPFEGEVEPWELLLDFLRDRLGLTGAKQSCEVQVCGVCTVLVDGNPVSSCCYLAADIDGREFAADTASLTGATPADFGSRAEACAEQAAAACTPLPDGEASADYLRHLVRVYARQALSEAFAAAAGS